LVLVQNVSKLYRLYRRPADRLRELLPRARPRHTDFWALRDIGFELRTPFAWRGNFYSPFVNVTAQKEFLGGGRVVTTTQVTTPLLPVLTPVPSDNRIYGKIAAGVAASLGGNVSASLNAATTFARQGGNDVSASLGIKVAF